MDLGYLFDNHGLGVVAALSAIRVSAKIFGPPERNAAFAGTARASSLFLRVVEKTACEEPRNLWR